jgi:hypothetical protein
MNPRFLGIVIIGIMSLVSACSLLPRGNIEPDSPIFLEELEHKLTDPRLLRKLGVSEIVIFESDKYWVLIGAPANDDPLGEMYYTIQDGWHLKADNEVMEFVRGKGWLIAEQD